MLCSLQSFLVCSFFKCSQCWTAMMSYQLYTIICGSKIQINYRRMVILCWIIPIGLTLLPLTTTDFGRGSSDSIISTEGWCWLTTQPENIFLLWIFLDFIVISSFCFFIMIFCSIGISIKWSTSQIDPKFEALVHTLFYYPIIFFMTWLPLIVFVVYVIAVQPRTTSTLSHTFISFTSVSVQNGTCLAILFFYKSPEARRRWYRLLIPKNLQGLSHNTNELCEFASADIDECDALVSTPCQGSSFRAQSTDKITTSVNDPLIPADQVAI